MDTYLDIVDIFYHFGDSGKRLCVETIKEYIKEKQK